jgi:hypothetical protein
MDLKTISALAVKMKITKEQFDSFKYFIFHKYKSQLNVPNKQWEIEEILKTVKSDLPSEKVININSNQSNKLETINEETKKNNLIKVTKKKPKIKKKKKTNTSSKLSENKEEKGTRKRTYRTKENKSIEESYILRIKKEYIRKPHTIKLFTEKMYWDLSTFIEWLNERVFDDVNAFTTVKLEYLEPIIEKIIDRRKEIIKWETEIVTKNSTKTKPNFFKLIYNSTGSKR